MNSFSILEISTEVDALEIEYFKHCISSNLPYFGDVMSANLNSPLRQAYLRKCVELVSLSSDKNTPLALAELGSWAGRSAITLALAAREFHSSGGMVTCVDAWKTYFQPQDKNEFNNTMFREMHRGLASGAILRLFEHNVRSAGVEDAILTCRGQTDDIMPLFADESFDLVFVDANHIYDWIKRDLRNSARVTRVGGFLCGDDLVLQGDEIDPEFIARVLREDLAKEPNTKTDIHPGVTQAVYEFFNGRVSAAEGFWAMRKTKDGWEPVDFGPPLTIDDVPLHAQGPYQTILKELAQIASEQSASDDSENQSEDQENSPPVDATEQAVKASDAEASAAQSSDETGH